MSEPERRLWSRLRVHRFHDIGFRRQQPIGPYIVDFYCASHRLIVEVDGGQHFQDAAIAADDRRDRWLRANGYEVARYMSSDVLGRMDAVLADLAARLCREDSCRQSLPNRSDT